MIMAEDAVEFTGYPIELERRAELEAAAIDFYSSVKGLFSAPEEIDPRQWHRIEYQKNMGSCQGHALSSVGEYAYHIATGEVTQFSPLFCYYATQRIDGISGDRGSTISGGARCAKENGFCPLDVMPYPDPVRYTGKIPPEAYTAATPFKIRSHSVCRNFEEVFAYLASGQGGVEIGIAWGGAMTPNSEGVIEQFRPGGGGHAVCFLGYSQRRDRQDRQYLWLANSWSVTWGNKGWAEVSPTAVDQMGRDGNTVMIGMSDLSTPEVRPYSFLKNRVI